MSCLLGVTMPRAVGLSVLCSDPTHEQPCYYPHAWGRVWVGDAGAWNSSVTVLSLVGDLSESSPTQWDMVLL